MPVAEISDGTPRRGFVAQMAINTGISKPFIDVGWQGGAVIVYSNQLGYLYLVLGLGVAKETRVVAPLPADGNTAYWRDPEGMHFVPKRSLNDLIIGRF